MIGEVEAISPAIPHQDLSEFKWEVDRGGRVGLTPAAYA